MIYFILPVDVCQRVLLVNGNNFRRVLKTFDIKKVLVAIDAKK
jgi:hypothetical protein